MKLTEFLKIQIFASRVYENAFIQMRARYERARPKTLGAKT